MHHRESRLVPNRVIAPDFGDVHLVLGREAARDIHGTRRNIEMKRRACASEVRPLRHGFEMVDRFGRLNLDRAHQLVTAFG
jgi:hypothetical protein